MSQLEPVTLHYKDKEYKVEKEDSIWGLIKAIEDVITFLELGPAFQTQKFPAAKIFRAYAAALNYAGAKTTPNEVRAEASYKDMGEMAGALAMILMMSQPGSDVNLGKLDASEKEVEQSKKKAKAS